MRVSKEFPALGLLVAGLLAVARASEGAPSAVPMTPAAAPLVGDAVTGKETFTQDCSICHGVGANGFIGPYIAGINWTVPGLHAIVRFGVGGYGGMPAFNADVVTEKNIADIAAYLASLPPASSPKPSTTSQTSVSTAPVSPSKSTSTIAASVLASGSLAPSAARPGSSAPGDPAHGRQVYTTNCAACHGANADGGIGPSLHGENARKDSAATITWIKNPLPPMPKLYPTVLSEKDVDDVAAYVELLAK